MAGKGIARPKSRSKKRQVAARQDIELRLAKAMAHPVRVKILEMMNERPVAPVEASEAIGTPLSNVSYHFRTLLELGCIEAVGKQQVRGSIKTTYRSRTSLLFDEIGAGTMDARADSHLSVTTLDLRWEAWEEVARLLEGTLDRIIEIKGEEEAREDGTERFPATIGLLAFESPKLYE
jgi:DNA-binding transcriptional ArsR family regulator